jgi:hypothetical protein
MQTSIFLDKLGQSHQDDWQHEDPGQAIKQVLLKFR